MKPSPFAEPSEPTASASTAPPARADEVMLEGPHSRLDELFTLFRVMADFLRTRAYQQHLRRIRRAYRDTRDTLLAELASAFGNVDLWGV